MPRSIGKRNEQALLNTGAFDDSQLGYVMQHRRISKPKSSSRTNGEGIPVVEINNI
jgi:hypothetical protein